MQHCRRVVHHAIYMAQQNGDAWSIPNHIKGIAAHAQPFAAAWISNIYTSTNVSVHTYRYFNSKIVRDEKCMVTLNYWLCQNLPSMIKGGKIWVYIHNLSQSIHEELDLTTLLSSIHAIKYNLIMTDTFHTWQFQFRQLLILTVKGETSVVYFTGSPSTSTVCPCNKHVSVALFMNVTEPRVWWLPDVMIPEYVNEVVVLSLKGLMLVLT